jgi:hypothetical protein
MNFKLAMKPFLALLLLFTVYLGVSAQQYFKDKKEVTIEI